MSEHQDDTPAASVEVLRAMWSTRGQDASSVEDDCGPQKSCKNMAHVGFDGLAEPGTDLTQAWRERLEREGKRDTTDGTIRDLVLGSDS